MTIDATHPDVEWCRRCRVHQAMRDLDGICPVCDPNGTQALAVTAGTREALAGVDHVGKPRKALAYSPPPVDPEPHIIRGTA